MRVIDTKQRRGFLSAQFWNPAFTFARSRLRNTRWAYLHISARNFTKFGFAIWAPHEFRNVFLSKKDDGKMKQSLFRSSLSIGVCSISPKTGSTNRNNTSSAFVASIASPRGHVIIDLMRVANSNTLLAFVRELSGCVLGIPSVRSVCVCRMESVGR